MPWNEDRLHRWLARRLAPRGVRGRLLSDAAHLARAVHRPVLCADQCLEGVHFERGARAAWVGRKAVARALSDLAASAARPRAVLLTVAVDGSASEAWLRAVILAARDEARRHGADLVGGDLARRDGAAALCVAALGERARPRAIGREHARAGDWLVLTGPTGGSRLGRHARIQPRIAEGLWLADLGVRAMLDVSDGLARDLARLARASRVRLELDRALVHFDARRAARRSGRTPLEHALHDGEDHELVAALPARSRARFERERSRRAPRAEIIGRVRSGRGLSLPLDESGARRADWDGRGGWLHGT